MEAVDLIENFASYWEQCITLDNPIEAQKQLITKVVDQVFVHDANVIGITLHGNYSIVLNEDSAAPDEMIERLSKVIKKGASDVENPCTQGGSDGRVVLAKCGLSSTPKTNDHASSSIKVYIMNSYPLRIDRDRVSKNPIFCRPAPLSHLYPHGDQRNFGFYIEM